MRILLSEGSSTSAREAVTLLGLAGYHVEICDPDPHCIARFSRFVRQFHRCPGLGVDPQGYVAFVAALVAARRFDVLLPIHEQGLALAKVCEALTPNVALALPAFVAYEQALSKVSFSRLLSELGLPQPRTQLIETPGDALAQDAFPLVFKSAFGTASRGVWIVRSHDELCAAVAQMRDEEAFQEPVLVQEYIEAPVEHAQAVFSKGEMLGMHAYRQVTRGAGGGDAIKESVHRPEVGRHLAVIGRHLDWHGALSVDYLAVEIPTDIRYIDCNPRLVEPVNAMLAGHDLLDLLLKVSIGEKQTLPPGRPGVRTHLALQALLGCALRTRSRAALLRECWLLATRKGPYSGSQEELTPLRWDWASVAPTLVLASWLLIHPDAAASMAGQRWGDHLLNAKSVRLIRQRVGI